MMRNNLFVKRARALLLLAAMPFLAIDGHAQGTWTRLTMTAPDYNQGVMILMTDGTVLVKTSSGGADNIGSVWNKLTPDIHGSYKDGTWSTITSMNNTRLYFSSQVLQNGCLYVAGGEYGTGGHEGEVYYPVADYWAPCPLLPAAADFISDANSAILTDGTVLQAIVATGSSLSKKMYIYDPVLNTYTLTTPSFGSANESAWVKLPDNSILFVDIGSTNAERYIPATHTWVHDASVPVGLYDPFGFETGAAIMLPNGKAFFIGSLGHTAYYTPSGSNSPGTWSAGPMIPERQGAPDAAAAMMVNGKVLCAVSDLPKLDTVFPAPMKFFEFDYVNDTFIRISAPDGNDSSEAPAYFSNMLCLPDGNILYCAQGDDQYYIYTPDGAPVANGKPTITSIIKGTCDTLMATGTLFNGITEGAGYGDDWQMATNYPIIRLRTHDTVYYATTYYWNSTGLCRGSLPDTTKFVLPFGIPEGTYTLEVVANGISSAGVPFTTCNLPTEVKQVVPTNSNVAVFPNPAGGHATVVFNSREGGEYYITLSDLYGRVVLEQNSTAVAGENRHELQLNGIAPGMYTVSVHDGTGVYNTKVMVN